MKRIIISVAALLLVGLASWFFGYKSSLFKSKTVESSSVVLEQINKITKLATVEGQFAEIYDYRQSYTNWPFEKKALVKVKAKALIGYDLSKMNIKADEATRTVTMSSFPDAELLSLDHDVEYYDLQEGLFNSFKPEDLTLINKRAKSFIEEKVMLSELLQASEEQRQSIIDLLSMSLKSVGWTLDIETPIPLLN